MKKSELKEVLERHRLWVESYGKLGERADLRNADLKKADLEGADLTGADLTGADLEYANLEGADLTGTNLTDVDLEYANLEGANLEGAILTGAILRKAKLADVKVDSQTAGYHLVCPEEGSFIGFKICEDDTIVKLLIPENAMRSSGTSRKCRASKAIVLEITDENGEQIETTASNYRGSFIYRVGETVEVKDFDKNRWEECSTGIHFFITKREAEDFRQ